MANELNGNQVQNMTNNKEKIAKSKIKPQSACKKWKSKKLGKNEYWTSTLFGGIRKQKQVQKKVICLRSLIVKDQEGSQKISGV